MTATDMQRPPFVYWTTMWILGSVHAAVLLFRDFVDPDPGIIVGRDFSNMWAAGQMALAGDAGHAFNVDVFRLELLDRVGILSQQVFSYPPHALFVDALVALPPYWVALIAWNTLSAFAFILAARAYLPQGFPPLLAALTPAATICMWDGQSGLLMGALWLIVYRTCDRRRVQAGLAAAAMTIKPHLGLLVAVLLLTRPKALVTAIVATSALIAGSGLAFGWYSWTSFLIETTQSHADFFTLDRDQLFFRMMPTVLPAVGGGWPGIVAQIVSAIFALWQLSRIRNLRPVELAFPAATATFLILPYAHNYDMTVVALGFAILLFSRWGELSWTEKTILTLGFLSPQLTFVSTPIAPAALALSLHIQCNQLLKGKEGAVPEEGPGQSPVHSPTPPRAVAHIGVGSAGASS